MNYDRSLSKSVSFAKRERLPVGNHLVWKIQVGYLRAIALAGTEYPKTLGIWGPDEYASTSMSRWYTCQFECLTDVTVYPVSINTIDREPLLFRYIEQMEVLLDIALERQVSYRLEKLFSWLATKFGIPIENNILIQVPLTHQDIADIIGSSREAVTRILRNIEAMGRIAYKDRLIVFKRSYISINTSNN